MHVCLEASGNKAALWLVSWWAYMCTTSDLSDWILHMHEQDNTFGANMESSFWHLWLNSVQIQIRAFIMLEFFSVCMKWPRSACNSFLQSTDLSDYLNNTPEELTFSPPNCGAELPHFSFNLVSSLWSQPPEGKTHLQKYVNDNIIVPRLCYSIFIFFPPNFILLMCKWKAQQSLLTYSTTLQQL